MPCPLRLCLALALALLCASAAPAEQPPLAGDDECEATGGEAACALSALQRHGRAAAARAAGSSAGGAEPVGDARWTAPPAGNETVLGWATPPQPQGFEFIATTTRYGTNAHTSCLLDSGALVAGTDYLAVASAQAMQDGCCKCNFRGGGGPTASMGCGDCARGRFIRRLPRGYRIWTGAGAEIFHKEYKIIVADICPKSDNSIWCPAHAGQTNTFHVYNHFDFATPPPQFDNYYFEFTPMECSGEMKARFARMSQCHRR